METITDKMNDLHLSDEFEEACKTEIEVVSARLELTAIQAVLFSLIISHCNQSSIRPSELAEDMRCSTIKMLMFQKDLEELVSRKLIVRVKNDDFMFRVPGEVLLALKEDQCYRPQPPVCKSCSELFDRLESIYEKREDEDIDEQGMHNDIDILLDSNKSIDFCRKISSLKFCREDRDLFLCFCHLFVNNGDDNIRSHDYEFLFEHSWYARVVRRRLENGTHTIITEKLVEYSGSDGILDKSSYKLTETCKREYLAELDLPNLESPKKPDVISSKEIVSKALFYTSSVNEQVLELQSLLKPKNFIQIQKRMKNKGLRCGFACLFYGGPGTGKTETVLQLAKITGRDIMMIDIPKVRSCWVGETEKNIKAVFDRYRALVKDSKRAPILLFNEADAIIGIRKEGAERSVDKMENTMQNIILQEMESLDGIMIATTNLTQNLDKAFERRFLYKIQFEKPDASVRAKIWHSMLPDVSLPIIENLSASFDFSGGQIENITRRYTIYTILHGDSKDVASVLNKYCSSENISKSVTKKIGFC